MTQLDRRQTSVMTLIAATTLWGFFSAGLALFGSGTVGPAVALGAAVPLLVLAVAAGRGPLRDLRAHPKTFLVLGFLEAVNITLYAAALAIGPTPVVVALHLTSPIILLLGALLGRRRPLDARAITEIALVLAAIVLVSMRPGTTVSTAQAIAGCALAFGSAVSVAALITLVARASARRGDPTVAASLQLGVAGVLTLPYLLVGTANPGQLLIEFGLGALLLGPGFALYWRAMRTTDAATAGVIGLNEAIVAWTLIAALDHASMSIWLLAAGGLIVIAIVLEQDARL
ncbi:EamA family transporter [Nocardia sp. NPDC056064]|uniref:EamA family transporter n=1 Tax=Nocardia sp. NPDC056064 TaxID=3345701 RepID=UPI0035D7F877